MRVAVIGSGYVGLVAAACLAELGNDVVCVDNDRERVAALVTGDIPIFEEHLRELLARHAGQRITFSSELAESVRRSSVIFIAVGTPMAENGDPDLSYVEAVAREIAGAIEDDFKVIICKSTVPVYTCAWVRRVLQLNGASTEGFAVVANPEFLREGTAVTDFLYPDRIVVGSDDARATAIMQQLYAPLTDGGYASRPGAVPPPMQAPLPARLILTSTKSAEIIKHASNAFLAMKISFINAVANICEAVNADVVEVSQGIGADSRIGNRFLNPGIGYGGSCFPKDIAAFRRVAKDSGYDFHLLDEVARINDEQRTRFLQKIRSVLWTLKGKRLAVLGLSFKGGTDDVRESPALALIHELLREKCEVCAYDPAAMPRAQQELGQTAVTFAPDPYAAATGCDALLVLTDWQQFTELDLERLRQELRYPIIIDGRNLFDPQRVAALGFTYVSVGRPEAGPNDAADRPRMPRSKARGVGAVE
jgi:UDPglucose 6-dehydrogenase